MNPQGLVLIVDDVPQNLQVLRSTLSKEGYRIAAANNGEVALRYLQKKRPDLILLDVMMPVINGFDVCRQIKEQEHLRDIPIIFLTARTEKEDVLEGFEAGGVDYVTKPFNMAELLSRVKTHLDLKGTQDALRASNQELQRLNDEKNEFLGIASHDLKNPLTAILMHAQTLATNKVLNSIEEYQETGAAVQSSGERMLDIINNLLNINRLESGHLTPELQIFELQELMGSVGRSFQTQVKRKNIQLEIQYSEDMVFLKTDEHILLQILDNLISNAFKYSDSGTLIEFGAKTEDEHVQIWIRDQGPGFTEADQEQMFQKFSRLSAQPTANEHSTGLGLSIVKKLADMLAIELSFESAVGQGTTFFLRLPFLQDPLPEVRD